MNLCSWKPKQSKTWFIHWSNTLCSVTRNWYDRKNL